MTLGQKQELFMRLLPLLINKAHELGYEIRGGDLFRDPRAFGEFGESKLYSNSKSMHKLKIAIDLNLFKNGKYLTDSENHRELGNYWKSLNELCRWGGDFNDANHYSLTHWGCA